MACQGCGAAILFNPNFSNCCGLGWDAICSSATFPTDEDSVINTYNHMLFDRKRKLISIRIPEW
jgi:hypothetical protein